ncbi:hypothetical protein, variant 1 [Aphanomyces astaci]|uniref:Cilia- and flagella-associated protein 157 n=1 Tax=Aphanomyces astaci TaxID=112090 RepID=W4FK17_APHAT|nr:hypothetical protein, variant 1 [Aphanomyces astaci]ETV67053.1 hypothetical protein, variant 1 [Aphanomyces astaci]|eukprot:XP_009843423.1 hypothetical protein, variant 1 [Aphanomyces astaci]
MAAMPDGIESFRVAAERALRDQRVQFDLKQREEDLVRLQAENVEMKAKMKEMKASMEANIEDRERVIMYKVKRIDELQDKLARREEDETGRMDRAVHTVTEQLGIVTAERDLLRSKCVVSDATLKDMEAFQAVKGSLEAELARLQAENTQIQAACAARLREVEVSHVMHLQRMKREKDDDVARTRRDMEKAMLDRYVSWSWTVVVVDGWRSLDGTTRRAVLENEKLTLELSYQSSKLEKMISQNEVLKRSKIESRNNTDILTEMTETLSKKVKFYEKLFQKMHQKERMAVEQQLVAAQTKANHQRDRANVLLSAKPPQQASTITSNTPSDTKNGSNWQEALDTHLVERYKTKRGIDVVVQYNQFLHGGGLDATASSSAKPKPKTNSKATAAPPRPSRRAAPVHYSPQVIESIRLPHIVDTGDRPYVPKAEYLESSTSHARPSRRTADGSYTART